MSYMYQVLISITGWLGVSLLLAAYFLLSSKKIDVSSRHYHLLNLAGSLSIVINTYYGRAWSIMILNVIFAGVAVKSLLSLSK